VINVISELRGRDKELSINGLQTLKSMAAEKKLVISI